MNGFTPCWWERRLWHTHSWKKLEQEQIGASLPMGDFGGSLTFLRRGSWYWSALRKDGLVKQNWGENSLNPNFLFLSVCKLFSPFSVALQVFVWHLCYGFHSSRKRKQDFRQQGQTCALQLLSTSCLQSLQATLFLVINQPYFLSIPGACEWETRV